MKSAALQWAALCVCPPAILATSVATVPSVKRAVHHATRTPAKVVKHRSGAKPVKLAAAAKGVPCDVAAAIPAPALFAYNDALPGIDTSDGTMRGADLPGLLTTGGGVPVGSGTPIIGGFGPGPIGGGGGGGTPGGGGDTGGGDTGGGDTGGGPGSTTPTSPAMPVPEPESWLMMIAGFGLVGIGLRWRRRRALATTMPLTGRTARRRTKAAGGASTVMASLGFGEVATGSASMATIAAKTMLCICPTVAIVGATVTVPPVRNAVHSVTRTAQVKSAMVVPVKPPCDPTLRSAEATPPSRIIDGVEAQPEVATALLASTSTGGL